MNTDTGNVVVARYSRAEVWAAELDHAAWERARGVALTRYWSGAEAPAGRHAEARVVWTDTALVARFVCRQTEPLVLSESPNVERKTLGLWDRDVCEIFVAPDAGAPERYFEFEAAPTGEWLDLAIRWAKDGRETDWDYDSGMTVAARVEPQTLTVAIRVPWEAFSTSHTHTTTPRAGERWRANLLRCVGAGDSRGYLAWQPTFAPQPNFHVPQSFGWLNFEKDEKQMSDVGC